MAARLFIFFGLTEQVTVLNIVWLGKKTVSNGNHSGTTGPAV